MNNKIDVKSSTIEKSLEIAKNFLDKLIMPSIEETGLLMKDNITMWRFKNQIKILNKAKDLCVKHKINSHKISLKVLSPLLEYSSLEEEEDMQDKWSLLLVNLIDSDQNIENHVFPYILSQLSKDEFFPLENVYNNCIIRRQNLTKELSEFLIEKPEKEIQIQNEIEKKQIEIGKIKNDNENEWNSQIWKFKLKIRELEREIKNLEYKENAIRFLIKRSESISDDLFKNFEISNLIRLGLVKEVREFYAERQTLEIPINNNDSYGYSNDYANVDLEIDMDSITEYILTELGELFFKACKEKI